MRRTALLIGLTALSLLAPLPAHAIGLGRAPDAIVTAKQVARTPGLTHTLRAPFSPPRHAFGSPAKRTAAPTAPLGSPSTASPASSLTENAAGISAAVDLPLNGGYESPSDSTGAAGPNHYIEVVNSAIEIFTRSLGAATGPVSLNSFTGTSVPFHFDPQIQWDPQSQRWYYALDAVYDGNTDNRLAFGWTKREADPTNLTLTSADWCSFEIATGADFQDFPKLGHDAANVIIGTNIFDTTMGSFLTGSIWVVPKPPAGTISSCGSPTAAQFGTRSSPLKYPSAPYTNQLVLTPVPANTTDGGSGDIVSVCCAGSTGKLFSWHVGAGPTLVADLAPTVSTFNQPHDIPQPGTSLTLDPSDTRLTQAVAHYDPDAGAEAVWTQHTVDNGGPSAVRWYEYIPSTGVLRQSGTVTSGSRYVFNGAISPVGAGNAAAVGYNTGSSSEFVAARAQSRISTDPLGQMFGEITLATSGVADTDFSCGQSVPNQCRWGDYAAASPDPSDPTAVWLTTMLTGTGGIFNTAGWATQNSALRLPLRIASTTGPTPSPAAPGGRISPGASSPIASPASRVSPQAPLTAPAASPTLAPAPIPAPGPAPAAGPAPAHTAAETPDAIANPLFGFTA